MHKASLALINWIFFFGQVFLKALKLLLSAENLLGKFSFYD